MLSIAPSLKFSQEFNGASDFRTEKFSANLGVNYSLAARALANRFGFKVDASYASYADVYRAIDDKMVDYGLVDDILVRKFLNKRFFQCGPHMSEELKPFYREKMGRDKEEYAIAVVEERGENLRSLINDILDSDAGRRKLQTLTERWVVSASR